MATSDHLVDIAIATMEWDDTVGMLSLLQRDGASTTSRRAQGPAGAFPSVFDGVGLAGVFDGVGLAGVFDGVGLAGVFHGVGLAGSSPLNAVPATQLQLAETEALAAERRAEQRAERQAERQADRQAERRAVQRAERQGERQADRQAERRAEQRAERQAEQRAEREAERRAQRVPAQTSDWNNAPHVTWYGPGFYGNTTACGQRYTRDIIGVAHRTLPCGTMVEFRWNGITATAPVIDRGPYGPASYVFDFSAALSCDVFKPRGVSNGCFTRQDVAWRIVRRPG